jgi:hypothetical protein
MPQLDTIENEPNIDSLKRADAPAIWNDFRAKAEALKFTAETLTVTSVHDSAGMKLARATRLSLREIRIAIEHKRKELGEYHLRQSQAINADAKMLKDLIEPLEARLEEQEKFVEREDARLRAETQSARSAECAPLLTGPLAVDLGSMPSDEYASLLQDLKDAHAARLDREHRAAEEAAAKVKADAEERERMLRENAQLRAEAEARETEARKERQLMQQEARAQAEKERQERAAIQAKADAERKAREAAEAVIAAQKADEAKRHADSVRIARRAAAAPDREKLLAYGLALMNVNPPLMAGASGRAALIAISNGVTALGDRIKSIADSLE